MRQLLKQTSGDLAAAAKLASAELDQLARRSDAIAQSITNMRRAAQQAGDQRLAAMIATADPFQGGRGAAVARLPALATPQAAIGFSRTQVVLGSLLFTLGNLGEQLSAADTKWQKLDRTIGTALQTIGTVGIASGTTAGQIIGGIAIVGNFISSFWTQQREEIERTARAAEERIIRLVDTLDVAQMMAQVQRLERGRPSAGLSAAAPGAFAGGIRDIEAQTRPLRERLKREELQIWTQTRQDLIDSLKRQIAELETPQFQADVTERDRLVAAILNPALSDQPIRGARAVTVADKRTAGPDEAMQALVTQTQSLMRLEKQLQENRSGSVDISMQLLENYDRINASLDLMGDKLSGQALQWRQLIAELNQSPMIQLLTRGTGPAAVIPGVSQLGTRGPMKPFDIKIPELERLPLTLGQHVKLALQPMVDAIKTMSGYLLNAGLSLLSRYGGAGGQVAAGVIGGAVAGAQIGGGWGAVIGGIVGVVDGLFSMGRAAKEANDAFREFLATQRAFLDQQHLMLGDMTQTQYDILQLQQAFAAQRAPIEQQLHAIEMARIARRMPEGWTQEYADLQKRLAELNETERRRIEQLQMEKKALDEMSEAAERFRNVPSWFKTNLEVWRAANSLPAGGFDRTRTATTRVGATSSGVVQIGTVTINTRATNARQLLQDFLAELKRLGLSTFGAGEEARILETL